MMHCVIGLGNIGAEYEITRHNVGFIVIDHMVQQYHACLSTSSKFYGACCKASMDNGDEILFLQPHTYMNTSGKSVAAYTQYYKIKSENVFVIHDELELALGKLRIRHNGGHHGHNGLRSIDGSIGKNYNRISIGIGRPQVKHKVAGYVLDAFSKAELEVINHIKQHLMENLIAILSGDAQQWTNVVNTCTTTVDITT